MKTRKRSEQAALVSAGLRAAVVAGQIPLPYEKMYVEPGREMPWEPVSAASVVEYTEGKGHWKPGTVLAMLDQGQTVRTPWAFYRRRQVTGEEDKACT